MFKESDYFMENPRYQPEDFVVELNKVSPVVCNSRLCDFFLDMILSAWMAVFLWIGQA